MGTVITKRSLADLPTSPRNLKKTPTSKFINSLQSPDRTPSTTATTPSPSSSISLQGEFYAIRNGKGVKHCIFDSWEHAKEHVHNFKDAVYNVFDKMEDALLYIRLPLKVNGNKVGSQKRKRTSILPCSSNAENYKKPRTVSTVQAPLPPASVNFSTEKENQEKLTVARPKETTNVVAEEPNETVEDTRPIAQILEEGYKKNFVKGWRANAVFPQKKQCREKWEKRYLEDVVALKHFRQHQSKSSTVRDVHKMNHCSGIPNAFSLAYLNWSWGVGEAYHRYLAFQQRKQKPSGSRQRMKNNKLKTTPANRSNHYSCSTCVITNREAARKRFTSKAMFYSFRVQQLAELSTTGLRKDQLPTRPDANNPHNQSPLVNGCSRSKEWMDEARSDWETLSPEDKAYWQEQERVHDEKQPEILKILEESLHRDPKRSAKRLSEDIGFWCGKTTIGKWKNLKMGPKGSGSSSSSSPSLSSATFPLSSATNQCAKLNATSFVHNTLIRTLLGRVSNSGINSQNGRNGRQKGLNVVVALPEVSDPSESTEDVDSESADEFENGPYLPKRPSTSINVEMEAYMEEEDLII